MTAKYRKSRNPELIPLLNDIVFRYVFGETDGLPYLKAMLNAFFVYTGLPTVAELSLLERRLGPRAQGEKRVYLDLVAKDETGRLVEIEVQTYRQASYVERSLFYWSQLYSRQLHTPEEYDKLRPVICVNLLSFILMPGEKWYTIDRLMMTDHLQLHFIELPKLPGVVMADAEKWARFLAAEGKAPDAAAELAASDNMLAAVHRRYEEFMSIDGKVLAAIAREKQLRDPKGWVKYAKQEGREEGLKEGLKEGQAQKAVEIAAALARKGVDPAVIKETTGVDVMSGE